MRTVPAAVISATLALTGLAVKPRVRLQEDHVVLDAPPAAVLAHFRGRFADDPEVIAAGPDRLVRRFQGRAGRFPYRTVEVVGFETGAVTFEHLRGPFSTCRERFDLTPWGDGTRLTHRGSFRLKGGLWTWPLAQGPVRRAFEVHVRAHLDTLRAERIVPLGSHEVTLLYFEDCPSWRVTDAHLTVLADERDDLRISRRPVSTPEEAEAVGFAGSPSILVDGLDAFAGSDAVVGWTCRIYQTPSGPAGSPTLDQLRAVLPDHL